MHAPHASIRRVQTRGQITIPEGIRDQCGIDPGADLLFIALGPDRFECQRLPRGASLLDYIDAVAGEGAAPDMTQLRDAMADEITKTVRG